MSVDQTIENLVHAWDAGDARAYADQFTEDATYVIFAGAVSSGREEIERDHADLFAGPLKGSRMRVRTLSTRYLQDDLAILLTEGGTGKRRIRLDKVQTYVLRRDAEGRWRCEAFQNTKKNPLMIRLAARGRTRQRRS